MIFKIPFALTDLNTYINKERSNKYVGAKIKKENTNNVMLVTKHLKAVSSYPVDISIEWHSNGRKDPDNLAFAIKFILDGLVKNGILVNDGQKQINSIYHTFVKSKEDYCIVDIKEKG